MRIELTWTRARDRSHWAARLGLYCCTIRPPNDEDPMECYWWEIAGATFGGRGGASSLALAKKMVAERIAECEEKLAKAPGGTTTLSTAEVGI